LVFKIVYWPNKHVGRRMTEKRNLQLIKWQKLVFWDQKKNFFEERKQHRGYILYEYSWEAHLQRSMNYKRDTAVPAPKTDKVTDLYK